MGLAAESYVLSFLPATQFTSLFGFSASYILISKSMRNALICMILNHICSQKLYLSISILVSRLNSPGAMEHFSASCEIKYMCTCADTHS